MEMSKSSSLVLERVEWMPLSTHSVNSVMVETLKTCDVSKTTVGRFYREGGEERSALLAYCRRL